MQIERLQELDRCCTVLEGQRQQLESGIKGHKEELSELEVWLELAPKVEEVLEVLSQRLLDDLVAKLEDLMTKALREVLEQPLTLKAETSYSRSALNVDFHIERDGQSEDIMRGQGGSVTNVLSVMLRFFALTTRDGKAHRKFLILDEQDCWLRPDLVPRLLEVVRQTSRVCGFQVLYISHHDRQMLERYCDKVYLFQPSSDGVRVGEVTAHAGIED